VPVLTITDLGMVRSVARHGDGWVIGFTPTYSGCPATEHLLGEIRAVMSEHGLRRCISSCSLTRRGPPTG
jgi:ring-1,2-phenylacetyl-CoA epoxidase subunit PaaD